MTKQNKVLLFLQKNRTITSYQAFEHFRITRLAVIIFCLRRKGYPISTYMKHCVNAEGEIIKYGIYTLEDSSPMEDTRHGR